MLTARESSIMITEHLSITQAASTEARLTGAAVSPIKTSLISNCDDSEVVSYAEEVKGHIVS